MVVRLLSLAAPVWGIVLGTVACPSCPAQPPAAPAPTAEAPAKTTPPPAAYTVSFRIIKIDVAEGLDRREFADLPDSAFFITPESGDQFYDRVQLRQVFGEAIRPGLVATVGPVYSVTVPPRAEPVAIRGVLMDGKTEWSVSLAVEPRSDDGMKVDLRSVWLTKDLLAFETNPDPGKCEMYVGWPMPMWAGSGFSTNRPDREVGKNFERGYCVLVLVEPAVM
ncbi:MAG TPA: hypothetical protein PLQ54_01325 [Armatimonadota bacterium]|nr:hypothetical protein [Armatimonadota bacterium]